MSSTSPGIPGSQTGTGPGPQPSVGFDFQPRTRIVFGPNTINRLGELAAEWSPRRVLVVTDPHIRQAGHADRAIAVIQTAGFETAIFDRVHENPTTDDVEACVAVAREGEIDMIVGLGGGSSMDTAKGCNFLLTNGGSMHDYWGSGKATRPMLPMIAVPTTAGTGSDMQSYALIADARTHQKMACGDPKAAPRVAVLDPTLTLTQPRQVTADTGIDALTHAVEAAVTRRHNALSLLFAREAFRLIADHLPRVLEDGKNLESRGQMLLAAAYAGLAIENSMLGAAHSCANPLSAHFGVVHGRAVGLMLPAVVRYNAADPLARSLYRQLAGHAGLTSPDVADDEAVAQLLQCIDRLLDAAGVPRSLSELQIPRSAVPTLAAEATEQWTAKFNPRSLTVDDFAELYASSFDPLGVTG